MSRVLLIIPAYNEQDSIENLINEINNYEDALDYIVINDCSNDHTEQILDSLGANYLSATINLGIGGAVQTGYRYAYENGYDIAIQVDGDGQHDISFVKDMVDIIDSDMADIVIGSRFISCEGFQSSASRRMGIGILSSLIRLCCGVKIYDVTSGFRAVNKKYIDAFAKDYPDDYPEPEVIVSSALNGARIQEIPVIMRERTGGVSSISIKKSVYYMIKVSIAIIICRLSLGVRTGNRRNGRS